MRNHQRSAFEPGFAEVATDNWPEQSTTHSKLPPHIVPIGVVEVIKANIGD